MSSATPNPTRPDLSSLRINEGQRKERKTGKILGIVVAAILLIALVAGAAYFTRNSAPIVEVAAAQKAGSGPTALLNASGYVTPRRRATIAAKITGRVIGVYFDEGVHVKEGQILAKLDDSDVKRALDSAIADRNSTQAQIADYQVQLKNAELLVHRSKELQAAGVQSQETLDNALTSADSLRAKIALTKEQVADGGAWEFNIRGIYNNPKDGVDLTQFWLHDKYLDERRNFGKGQIGWYTVSLSSPDDATRVIKVIDDQFANSPFETKTETLAAMTASWVKQAGNIEFLILAIGGVVFFTLLLVTGNTMALSVRERMAELAVMKAVGFSNRFVLLIVLAESLVIAVIGGTIGILLAKLMTLGGDPTGGILYSFILPVSAMLLGLVAALAIGMMAGIIPATNAMRLRVVDALRRA